MRAASLLLTACGLSTGCLISDSPPVGIALLRISEVPGACVVDRGLDGELDIPTNLPFRRTRATASFRASEWFVGGHHVAVGYQDYDGRLGLLQFEIPPTAATGSPSTRR